MLFLYLLRIFVQFTIHDVQPFMMMLIKVGPWVIQIKGLNHKINNEIRMAMNAK
jgi:hypothetical protein